MRDAAVDQGLLLAGNAQLRLLLIRLYGAAGAQQGRYIAGGCAHANGFGQADGVVVSNCAQLEGHFAGKGDAGFGEHAGNLRRLGYEMHAAAREMVRAANQIMYIGDGGCDIEIAAIYASGKIEKVGVAAYQRSGDTGGGHGLAQGFEAQLLFTVAEEVGGAEIVSFFHCNILRRSRILWIIYSAPFTSRPKP